jgi:hypothetical protein
VPHTKSRASTASNKDSTCRAALALRSREGGRDDQGLEEVEVRQQLIAARGVVGHERQQAVGPKGLG